MKIVRHLISVVFLFLFFINPINAKESNEYITKIENLPLNQQKLYFDIKHAIDGDSKNEKFVNIKDEIDSFVKTTPNFLPIYIEKARYLIIFGYAKNDFIEPNKDALKIILDLQNKNPSYAQSFVLAGHVYTNLGEFNKAEKSLIEAQKLNSTDAWLYLNWAALKINQGDMKLAYIYANKGLLSSGDNTKELLSAINFINITNDSKNINNNSTENIKNIVVKDFPDYNDRLIVAERLIESNSGRSEYSDYAMAIIKSEPDKSLKSPFARYLLARLTLKDGYINTSYLIDRFTSESIFQTENELKDINSDPLLMKKIDYLKMLIFLSRNDFKSAMNSINKLKSEGGLSDSLLYTEAIVQYSTGHPAEAIKTIDSISNTGHMNELKMFFLDSFEQNGDLNVLDDYYKHKVKGNPFNAWPLGNYSLFLLFRKDDINGAIKYGNDALEIMKYPLATNTTSLAYLIKASIDFKNGATEEAIKSYEAAKYMNYSDEFINDYCSKYCRDISIMVSKINHLHPVDKNFKNAN